MYIFKSLLSQVCEKQRLFGRGMGWVHSNAPATSIDSLTSGKTFDFSKFKAFSDDKFSVYLLMSFVFRTMENIVGKGENADTEHFLCFLQCFEKRSQPVEKLGVCGKWFITI